MTRVGEPLDIRPPGWARVLGPVLLLVWVAVSFSGESDGAFVPGLLIAVLAGAVVVRLFLSSAIGTADGRLTVRNVRSTRTFTRDEIDGVEVDRVRGRGWAVWIRLADGERHRLDVTEAPFLGPFQGTLDRQAAEVHAWLTGRPHAHL
ncbi:hypothetical protein SAMN04515665_12810 [Blastococcus sp. DSM 46786]|uniref:hypothetical protein n=1 Tax=Blastococcus sp. DSM 46786 TaxID=1798227 RepID=UPI0008B50013|nr:hypothetical protein [Blastococcus sp. DSM 46786]SEM05483.1 hypothetical protein SAMN04515665_12810 [Blastococcus sp. DSM 46786]